MAEQEGVIKYRLEFEPGPAPAEDLTELNVWRSILYNLGLIGQHPELYGGYAYGNISLRSRAEPGHFFISATQTGQLPELQADDYVCIEKTDIADNRVYARGPRQPSSEAMTHAAIYQLDPAIQCVMHVHDPKLWHCGLAQSWPTTAKNVDYGTPAMAAEILRLYESSGLDRQRVLVMAGHLDGVVSFGRTIDEAGCGLLDLWMTAYQDLRTSG